MRIVPWLNLSRQVKRDDGARTHSDDDDELRQRGLDNGRMAAVDERATLSRGPLRAYCIGEACCGRRPVHNPGPDKGL